MKRNLQIVIFFILPFFVAHAQMGKLFNADNQLSSNFANQVFQDNDGFIWVATRNGLNRYDGYQVRIFRKEDEETCLSSNYINCITQDQEGTIYVGSNYTVQYYDGAKFHDFIIKDNNGHEVRTYINYLMENSEGEILACTSGYGIIKLDRKTCKGIKEKEIAGNEKFIRYLLEDKQGRFWLITESNGLFLIENNKRTQFFKDEKQKSSLSEIKQDKNGHIYLAVNGAGVYQYDERQREFIFIPKTSSLPVTSLYTCNNGQLLLGCDGQGIKLYDPKSDNITDNPFYSRDMNLNKGKVSSILEDRNGNIWIGLLQKGVFMQPKARMAFGYMGGMLGDRNIIGTNCVSSVLIDSQERAWVGTDKDGLYMLIKESMTVQHITNCPSTILSMVEDSKGRIWIGSYGEGCGWIDPKTNTWHYQDIGLGQNANVFGLAASSKGDVWIATMGNGLLRLDTNTGEITTFRMKNDADNNRQINSLPNDYLSKICLSPDENRLFVASSVGLCCYDIQKDSWTNTFNGNCANMGTFSRSVFADQKNRAWLATNEGLYCYDLNSHKSRYYTTNEGLPTNGISSIIADRQGNIWLGTDRGLSCFDPNKTTFINYYVDNGLQGNEFSDGASSIGGKGTLLLGGTGGITWFEPSEMKPSTWNADIRLTGFTVGHNNVTAGMKSGVYTITDSTIINTNKFDLCANDNSFSIQFSTFTYDNPEHITYLYSLNDGEWTLLKKGANEITFSELPPGTYNFRVKAINNQQETDVRRFTVKIHSPWYASIWAWMAYLLVAALVIWGLIRYRRHKELDKLRLQEHIHAEQMADAKLRFFMNISHEIRTPMTLIVTPLLSLIKQDDNPQRRSIYETIRRNAERILGLINQMMDLRKIDKGQMQMHMCETDLINFVGDIYTLFAQQAKTRNIQFTYEHDTDKLPIWIDRGNFDKVVVNILSNAFKFTQAGGIISINITHDNNQAVITIYDNGNQIPPEQLENIFKRFYQLPNNANDRNTGTGIGLDLTRSLVELHHGTIKAHNCKDAGCEFIVTLPLGNSHLQPDEMITDSEEMAQSTFMEEELTATDEDNILPKNGKRKCILIVEDDNEIREYLESELASDYDIVTANDGMQALKTILTIQGKTTSDTIQQPLPIDMVITDIMMPEMDGYTLCAKIKSNPKSSHIPVIMLTAKNRDEDQLEGLETGADAYVVKPFNMDILRRTIINLLHTHEMLKLKYGRNDQLEEKIDNVKMKSPDDKLLERVMNVINKNLSNPDLSVDRIADEVGISRVHLHRKMKELTGQTPHEFIRNLRLKQAANLLSDQSMSITEVMYACGFNNSSSFSTIFKKFYGLSPRDYMREHEN